MVVQEHKDSPRKSQKQWASTGARVLPSTRRTMEKLFLDGYSFAYIARVTHHDRRTVTAVCRGLKNSSGDQHKLDRIDPTLPDPRTTGELTDEARRALEDFGYFRARYFGRTSTPWQEEAAYRMLGFLHSPEKEYVVVNAPPSVGKSTLFTHDIPAWMACRDRSIRCLIGSRTFRQAKWYTGRLRRSFERAEVLPADEEEVAAGRAVAPVASLVADFGRFRPQTQFTTDIWRAEEFVLAQPGDVLISEKEASFAAYGMDSGFLGGRFKLVVWDDLVDRKNIRNTEALEALAQLYEDEAETRLEPGGLLILQGQRMSSYDLYRHCLDQRAGEADPDEEPGPDDRPAKYHHVVYKAHYDEVCRGRATHLRSTAPYWRPLPDGSSDPEGGCLLDPRRLTYQELSTIRRNRRQKFAVLYQQEDTDPDDVLVPRLWVDGGTDPSTGEVFPGCWDKGRGLWDLPKGLVAPTHIYASVDPSPTMYWSCQIWAYNQPTSQLFLLDLVRRKMDAPEFLDWNPSTQSFSGLAEEWQLRSEDLGIPISHWIVEANAAQRFLLQYEFVRQWMRVHRVGIVPHQTTRNKTDPEYGVQAIAPLFRHGLVRLPSGGDRHGDTSRLASIALVDEVTRYPDSRYDDSVMAMWMGVFNRERLFRPVRSERRPQRRPSWLGGAKQSPLVGVR